MQGTADFALHVLSATQERAQEVDFVRPFFYSSGVALYTFPVRAGVAGGVARGPFVAGTSMCLARALGLATMHAGCRRPPQEMGRLLEGAGGWEGLEGSKICLYDGYYASGMIQNEYNITAVAVPSKQAGAEAVRAGQCMAVAADAGQPTFGAPDLEQVASISPILTAPCERAGVATRAAGARARARSSAQLAQQGAQACPPPPAPLPAASHLPPADAIPVAKGRTSLRHRLSAALVDLMQVCMGGRPCTGWAALVRSSAEHHALLCCWPAPPPHPHARPPLPPPPLTLPCRTAPTAPFCSSRRSF